MKVLVTKTFMHGAVRLQANTQHELPDDAAKRYITAGVVAAIEQAPKINKKET